MGVNKFTVDDEAEPNVFPIDPTLAVGQLSRLKAFKENRDQAKVQELLEDIRTAARGTDNLLIPMKEALRAHATLGEVSDALRDVYGTYKPGR